MATAPNMAAVIDELSRETPLTAWLIRAGQQARILNHQADQERQREAAE